MKFSSDISGNILVSRRLYSCSSAAYLAFGTCPDNTKPFRAKMRLHVTSNINTAIDHDLLLEVVGTGNAAPRYRMLSSIFSATAANTGLYYVRFVFPKALNNGYNGFIELYAYNTTARIVDIELYEADNFELFDNLVASTYNGTYHSQETPAINFSGELTSGSLVGSFSGYATGAYYLSYGQTPYPAGIAMSGGKIAFLASDNKFYPITQNTVGCRPNSPIVYAGTVALNASVSGYDRYAVNIANTFSITLVVGYDVYMQGTVSTVTGLFTPTGLVTQTKSYDFAYRRIGIAYSTTSVFLDGNTDCFVLDSTGSCTYYNGMWFINNPSCSDYSFSDSMGVQYIDLSSSSATINLWYDGLGGDYTLEFSGLPMQGERIIYISWGANTSSIAVQFNTTMGVYGWYGGVMPLAYTTALIRITAMSSTQVAITPEYF